MKNLMLEAKVEGTKNLYQGIRFCKNKDGSVSFATGLENPPAIVREDQEVRFTYAYVLGKVMEHFTAHKEEKCGCPLLAGHAAESIDKPRPTKTKFTDPKHPLFGLEISR